MQKAPHPHSSGRLLHLASLCAEAWATCKLDVRYECSAVLKTVLGGALTNAAVAVAAAVLGPLGQIHGVRIGQHHEVNHLAASKAPLSRSTMDGQKRSHAAFQQRAENSNLSETPIGMEQAWCLSRQGFSPANPEPGAGIGQLLVRATLVDLEAQDALVECHGALQVLHQEPNVVHSVVDHTLCNCTDETSAHCQDARLGLRKHTQQGFTEQSSRGGLASRMSDDKAAAEAKLEASPELLASLKPCARASWSSLAGVRNSVPVPLASCDGLLLLRGCENSLHNASRLSDRSSSRHACM